MKRYLFGILAVLGFVGLLAAPTVAAQAGKNALMMCLESLIPTLFPFFVFSSLFVSLGFAEITGRGFGRIMKPLFNIGGAAATAFLLGLVSGFPVGARTAISLYNEHLCSKEEAERTLAFCNNAGPAFVLGTVGVGIWSSTRVGWLLWVAQVIASVITGVVFGRLWKSDGGKSCVNAEKKPHAVRLLPALVDAVRSSSVSVLYITAFIVFFAIVIAMLSFFGVIPTVAGVLAKIPVSLSQSDWEHLLSGIVEFTSGIKMIGATEPFQRSLTLTAAILGWAGLSVHCQVLSFVCDSGLSAKPYILGKVMQTALSSCITYIMSFFFDADTSAFASFTFCRSSIEYFFLLFAISCAAAVFFGATILLSSEYIIKRK